MGPLRGLFQILVADDWRSVQSRVLQEWRAAARDDLGWPSLAAQELLIAGEDHRFLQHPGCDPYAIGRAVYRRAFSGRVEGASTIAQQLVRVLTGRYERTALRKVREILLACLLTAAFPRAILPGLYLRVGYFGWRMNGGGAARSRLGLNWTTMSGRDAAELVARLKYPEPQTASAARLRSISRRADHLLALRDKHSASRANTEGERRRAAIQGYRTPSRT